jgi:cell division protein FtsN
VLRAPASGGLWSIQIGAFASAATARAAAESVRAGVANLLGGSRVDLPPTSPFGGNVLYRARLAGRQADAAADACVRLRRAQIACMVIPPGQP